MINTYTKSVKMVIRKCKDVFYPAILYRCVSILITCLLGMQTVLASGDENITINSTATSATGTWTVTGGSVPYTYTFQPNSNVNVANLNAADIIACLTGSNTTLGGGGAPPNTNGKAGNVIILTASTGAGAGTGNVTISQSISSDYHCFR